ncbi:MAG: efflux transporter outer membrane subunit [Bradymonadaceae bacterium]
MWHRGHLVIWLTLAAAIPAGCASEKHAGKRDAVVEVPEEYGVTDIEGIETEAWCSDFGQSELDKIVRRAWDESLELKAAWARLEQAKAQVAQARSQLWPELGASAEATASNATERLPDTLQNGGDGPNVGTRFEATLAASYEVDLWGKYRHRAKAAKLEMRATRSNARALAITLTSRVAGAWFDIVAARQRLELLEQQIKVSKELLELTETRFRHGVASELDIRQQRQNLESLKGVRVEARRKLKTSRHRLAVLTGTEPGDLRKFSAESLPELPPLPDPGVPADLLQRRPDIKAALFQLRAADQQTAAAVADRLPTMDLSASLFLQAGQIANLLDDLVWSASALVSQTIFDGGRLKAAQREAESVAEERLYRYGQTLLEALEDVRNALVGEKYQKERLASLRRERKSAKASLEAARSQYRNGNIDYFRVLDALLRLQEVERQLLAARRRQLAFRVSLCRAIGGSWATELESSIASENE